MSDSFDILIFQHFCFILGGVETLYYRMMRWAHSHDIKSILVIDANATIDISWKEKLKVIDVELYYIYGIYPYFIIKKEDGIILDLSAYKNVFYISEYFGGYLKGEYIKRKNNFSNFVNLLYVLTAFDIMQSKIFFVRYLENKILLHITKSNSVVFMDEQIEKTLINAHRELPEFKHKIIRLGYEIGNEVSEKYLCERYNNKKRYICAVARFDFPFKIYILGLIEVFAKICKQYPELRLLLIGKGDFIANVKETINALNKETAEKITLIEGLPYDELILHMKNAFLNVGMGTTILDFANQSVPSIISLANEEKDISYGLWSDNWNVIGGFLHDDLASLKPISECIRDVMGMSREEYVQLCKRHRLLLVKHYSMEHIMKHLFTHRVSTESYINPFVLHFYSVFLFIRFKLEKLFPQLLSIFSRYTRR